MATHRFTMTITSSPRNHGNTELINSGTEEPLVHVVHAAFLCVHMNLTQGLSRFVCDVLGYINHPASYSPPDPYPTIINPSLIGCSLGARACVSVDIFPAFPREWRRRKNEKYSHVLSGELKSAMFAPLFAFSSTLLQKRNSSLSLCPLPFLPLSHAILCALKLIGFLFFLWELPEAV